MIASWNDHLCQIRWNWPSAHLSAKNKKIKEERLYLLTCQFSSTTLKTCAHHQIDDEHTLSLQHSGHIYKVRRAITVLEIQNKSKILLLTVCLRVDRITISLFLISDSCLWINLVKNQICKEEEFFALYFLMKNRVSMQSISPT